MSNNEIYLVTDLLANPRLATEVTVDPKWFVNPSMVRILSAIEVLKGTPYQVADVYRELKAAHPFECGTLDELELLAGNYKDIGITHQLANMVHTEYLDREIKATSQSLAATGSEKDAGKLRKLLDEKESVRTLKSDGRLDNAYREYLRLLESDQPLLKTFDPLDTFLGGGLSAGQLVVIGARPAVGKTALGVNMALQILKKNEGSAVDFFTLEMTDWQLMSRVVAKQAKINSVLLRSPSKLTTENRQKVEQAFENAKAKDFRIFGAEYQQLNDIRYMIRKRAKGKANRYVAFIDYAGLINVADGRKNERQALNEVTRELKLLTNDLQISIVLFAQLNRGLESRQDKEPTLADLKESGSLEQDANVVMLLSRNKENNNIIDCQIAKNREGMIGCVPFKFIPQFMDFSPDWNQVR